MKVVKQVNLMKRMKLVTKCNLSISMWFSDFIIFSKCSHIQLQGSLTLYFFNSVKYHLEEGLQVARGHRGRRRQDSAQIKVSQRKYKNSFLNCSSWDWQFSFWYCCQDSAFQIVGEDAQPAQIGSGEGCFNRSATLLYYCSLYIRFNIWWQSYFHSLWQKKQWKNQDF